VTPDKVDRCLERPEVVRAIGEDLIAQQRATRQTQF
jgi:hypothetical protein